MAFCCARATRKTWTATAPSPRTPQARLAVIRDQAQHQTARALGVTEDQITVFETYIQAAQAVAQGQVDAYASVARAHSGFIAQHPDWSLTLAPIPEVEKPPAFGAFAVARTEAALRDEIDAVLGAYLGSAAHRDMAAQFGFSARDVDRIAEASAGLYRSDL